MTAAIIGFAVDSFKGGKQLVYAAEPGVVDAMTKDGVVAVPYRAGDIILADPEGGLICGPVGPNGAIDLAERVLDGDSRAITDPLALFVLASAVVGFLMPGEAGEAPAMTAGVTS